MIKSKTEPRRELERESNRLRWRAKRDKYNRARREKRRAQKWTFKVGDLTGMTDQPVNLIFDKFEAPCVLMQLDGPPILVWRRGDGTLREMPVDEIISLLKSAEVDR